MKGVASYLASTPVSLYHTLSLVWSPPSHLGVDILLNGSLIGNFSKILSSVPMSQIISFCGQQYWDVQIALGKKLCIAKFTGKKPFCSSLLGNVMGFSFVEFISHKVRSKILHKLTWDFEKESLLSGIKWGIFMYWDLVFLYT